MALSEQTYTELARLAKRWSDDFWRDARIAHQLAALTALRDLNDPEAAPYLGALLLHADERLQPPGLELLTQLLGLLPAESVPRCIARAQNLDHQAFTEAYHHWHDMTADDVARAAGFGPIGTGFLVLASGHRNGRVREAAVHQLVDRPAPYVIAALKERLNDWVGPIRIAARAAMAVHLNVAQVPGLIATLGLLEQLAGCGRGEHEPMLERIRTVVCDPAARDHLRAGAAAADPAVRHPCFRLLLAAEDHAPEIQLMGLRSADPWIRLAAAQSVRTHRTGRDGDALLRLMVADPLRPVRQEALLMLVQLPDETHTALLRQLLFDRNPTIRHFARFHLGQRQPGFAADALYRDALVGTDGRDRAACLVGLGETGTASDAAAITPYLSDPRPRIRGAAYRALDLLLPLDAAEAFTSALRDRSGWVRKVLFSAMQRRCPHIDSAKTIVPLLTDADPVMRRFAVRLLLNYGGLEQLTHFLLALADPDAVVRSIARAQVHNLVRKVPSGYRDLPQQLVRELASTVARTEPGIRQLVSDYLRHALRPGVWPGGVGRNVG